jgi:hypothetical protein
VLELIEFSHNFRPFSSFFRVIELIEFSHKFRPFFAGKKQTCGLTLPVPASNGPDEQPILEKNDPKKMILEKNAPLINFSLGSCALAEPRSTAAPQS